jgi:tetratricopeptide (TPR) repeat protein
VIAAFQGVWWNGFVSFDDDLYLTRNPRVAGGLSPAGARWALTTTHGGNWHPLTWLSHQADVALFGLEPAGHHLVSLALHVASTLLLFLLLSDLTGRLLLPSLGAALFGLHPLRVESVAWASQRKDVLSVLLAILTLVAWVRHRRRPSPRGWILPLGLYLLSLTSKQTAVTLPLLMLLLLWWPLGHPVPRRPAGRGGRRWRPHGWEEAPEILFFAMAAAVAATTVFVVQRREGALLLHHLHPRGETLANALVSIPRYLAATLLPADLTFLYPFPPQGWPARVWLPSLLLTTGLLSVSISLRRRLPSLAAGWWWFLVALLPVGGWVQIGYQAMADRYTYLPHLGLALALAGVPPGRRLPGPLPPAVVGAAIIGAFGAITAAQVPVWRNDESLFRRAIALQPRNWLAMNNLAENLLREGRLREALELHQQALQAKPDEALLHLNYARALLEARLPGEARREAEEALRLQPGFAAAALVLARIARASGDPPGALVHLTRAVAMDPRLPAPRLALGTFLAEEGRPAEALEVLTSLVALAPEDPAARRQRGVTLSLLGRRHEAVEELRRALALDPGSADAHHDLGLALLQTGRREEGIRHLRRALLLDPAHPRARHNLNRAQGAPSPDPVAP